MITPGPDHPITMSVKPARVRVVYNGHQIADSRDVLVLQEANYPPVYYFPRGDVEMAFLPKTSRKTHCPYKGDASYFTLDMDGEISENAVWSYEDPFPAVEKIRERLAFYPQYVEISEAP
jgi:uncharacterized protein (DUF427 family)